MPDWLSTAHYKQGLCWNRPKVFGRKIFITTTIILKILSAWMPVPMKDFIGVVNPDFIGIAFVELERN
jgi:hypothetical protein